MFHDPEQIADELIANRTRARKAVRRRRGRSKFSYTSGGVRLLTLGEVAEFRGHVRKCIERMCASGYHCWQPDCPRCKPA